MRIALAGSCRLHELRPQRIVINSFSTCVYEAMTLGIPVVASDMPCNREALSDGSRGELVRNGDARDLARGITALLDAPERTDDVCR
ncbi:glycosyltransferase [Streptomyces sp. NPDC005548]|uniref:glycosyltransferase n=1 Tax=Streptomyces sp. NPDC005548 TaxID=3364724 RepID=UPI003680287A